MTRQRRRQQRQEAASIALLDHIAVSAKRRMGSMNTIAVDLPVAEVLQAYRETKLRPMVCGTFDDGCACPLAVWAIWKGHVKANDGLSISHISDKLDEVFGDEYVSGLIAGIDGLDPMYRWSERRMAGYERGREIVAVMQAIESAVTT